MTTNSGGPSVPNGKDPGKPSPLNGGHGRLPTGPGATEVSKGPKPFRPVAIAQRPPNDAFFKSVVGRMRSSSRVIWAGLGMSGLSIPGRVLMVAVAANLGNPLLFSDKRNTWKEMHGWLKGAGGWDTWLGYFNEIPPRWKGHAVDLFQQYIRFKLTGMFDTLGASAKDYSAAMEGQRKDVLEYDLAAVTLFTTVQDKFALLLPASTTPMGRLALLARSAVFLTSASALLKQFADIYNQYESQLNDLEMKLYDVKGAFYIAGDQSKGPRDMHADPAVADPKNWTPVTPGGK
ncbi:hypothetical protein ACQPYK_05740 [Streptosporangium sp. CA-135522]|uniref:hypothetical protein n=1 Tax=Streptosporangium sp. CA-135522 TaxID=3240072 RepID=UPI003D92B96F